MASTRVSVHLEADRARVYRTLLDPDAIAQWRVPEGMGAQVHEFDAREGGTLRVTLSYDALVGVGKSTADTDTYRGRFVRLVPDELVVEVDEFETDDPSLRSEMTMTITLSDSERGGTDLVALHEGLPDGVPTADNEEGWRQSLARLARLVED